MDGCQPRRPATIAGRLVDEQAAPVAGAQVRLLLLATAGEERVTTGPDGRFQFDRLPPGDVLVAFTAPDGREQWAFQKATAEDADRITLSLGEVTTINEALLPLTALAG
ncbi:MAG: carboxypeptidase-like regulatory domain-containing protein [Actinoplanes sp.]